DPLRVLPSALAASLRGLAHELRNPLAGIKGAAQLLARRVADPGARELVGLVQAEVERLAGLVDELLAPAPPRPHAPLNVHGVLGRRPAGRFGWCATTTPACRTWRATPTAWCRRPGTWCATRSRPAPPR